MLAKDPGDFRDDRASSMFYARDRCTDVCFVTHVTVIPFYVFNI